MAYQRLLTANGNCSALNVEIESVCRIDQSERIPAILLRYGNILLFAACSFCDCDFPYACAIHGIKTGLYSIGKVSYISSKTECKRSRIDHAIITRNKVSHLTSFKLVLQRHEPKLILILER